jgi:hypothetical protein
VEDLASRFGVAAGAVAAAEGKPTADPQPGRLCFHQAAPPTGRRELGSVQAGVSVGRGDPPVVEGGVVGASPVRRIDRDLARLGVNWSFPGLAALDPGRSDSRLAGSDLVYSAVQLMLSGGAGITMGTIGALACALAPAGGVAPLAGQVEYRWPISRGEEPSDLPDDDDVLLALLGGGDLRDQARDLAMTVPAAKLRDAFDLAAGLPEWAGGTCAAVEREIAAGRLGEAVKEWIRNSFGLTRLLLVVALRDRDAGPASTATTAWC